MLHIRKIKTISGEYKYALVELFTSETVNLKGEKVVKTDYLPVDYKSGKNVLPAVFPFSDEGLKWAKKVQKIYKK